MDKYLTEKQAAELSGFSIRWFQHERWTNSGPPYRKINNRSVRYLESELREWIESHKVNPTSQSTSI